jgi:predicted nuclease of predicted toxin-antitoxin system
MRLLVDMNLAPRWCVALAEHGIEAVHWSEIGAGDAADEVIMRHARDHRYVVLTHDLDFGVLLALTYASGPSVVQLRTPDPMATRVAPKVARALTQHRIPIESGALVTVDEMRSRVRILPLRR